MGMLLILLLLIGAGFAYRWLVQIEKEIRAEIAAAETAEPAVTPVRKASVQKLPPSTSERVVDVLKESPGMLQKDIYAILADIDRSAVQKELLELVRSGRLSRARSGKTYQLNLTDI